MGRSRKKVRSVLLTRKFAGRLEESCAYYASKSPGYLRGILVKLRDKTIPHLQKFPEMGAAVEDMRLLTGFSDSPLMSDLLTEISQLSRKAKLSLREILLDRNFKILYGFNDKVVVLLTLKHMSQRGYR